MPLAYSKHNPDPSSLSADSLFDLIYQEKAQRPPQSHSWCLSFLHFRKHQQVLLIQFPQNTLNEVTFHCLHSGPGHQRFSPIPTRPQTILSLSLFFFLVEAYLIWGFSGGSVVKNLLAKHETQVQPWVGKIPWRRKWQPTPVFLPGKSPGQRSQVG